MIETGLLSCVLIATVIAFRIQRRRAAAVHAKINAVLASAQALDLAVSMRATEQEERPTLH